MRKQTYRRPNRPARQAGHASWEESCAARRLLCLLLALATLAVFLPVARQGYVNYDDSDYVTENAHVQSGLKWDNVVWAFKTGHASNWHPLTWLSHMLDCQLFGPKARAATPRQRGLSHRQHAACSSCCCSA